jgi:GWxTD domain-containing protein
MNKFSILFFAFLFSGFQAHSQLQAIFGVNTFMITDKSPYIEASLMINGSSVTIGKIAPDAYRASVTVQITISKGDEIFYADKYSLQSPIVNDTGISIPNFIDLQRITIPNGKYLLELEIKDDKGNSKPLRSKSELHINFTDDQVTLSDINFIESISKSREPGPFTKSGMELIPHISSFYASDEDRLIFYAEIYNTSKILGYDQKFLINYFIENIDNKRTIPNYTGFKKFTAAPTNVVLQEFDITKLGTGNYNIVIEVRDKENTLITTKKSYFQRSNNIEAIPLEELANVSIEGSFADNITGIDTLSEYIRCLRPIATPWEQQFGDNQLKEADEKLMQQFFYSFWHNRDSSDPEGAWLKYKKEVKKVNKEFSTLIKRGYMTDRGRVYLQYGPPDTRAEAPYEPAALPYEIWHYYKLKNQNDRRFVFCSPDLISNDFELIHSTAYGEIMDERFHLRILRRDTQTHDLDMNQGSNHYGTRILDLYNNPR